MHVTVRRLHRREVAEGRWGSLIKCGVTKCMTDRRRSDSLSSCFVVMIREVVQYPNSKKFKCYETETLDGPSCLERSVIPAIEGNEESRRRICEVWNDEGHDGPSRGPSIQPRFDRFSVIRILLLLGFIFIINSSKNLILGVRLFVSKTLC